MTNIIYGASGFLGSSLLNWLDERGEETICLSFRPQDLKKRITELESLLSNKQIETIYNVCACQSSGDEITDLNDLIASNVMWPNSIASLLKKQKSKTKLICFGSSWQFDDTKECNPFNLYASTKMAAQDLLQHYAMDGVKIAYLILYDTYGPGDNRRKIINLIINALLNNDSLDMTAGDQLIDLVHIEDVLRAINIIKEQLSINQKTSLLTYSVRSGKPRTVKSILQIMRKILNKKKDKIILGKRPYRERERFNLPTIYSTPPGWAINVQLEDGLKMLLEKK